ncbi:hypothetical protein PISS_a2100 [Pseudoalteromonas issachenkonii]|uniref:Uncharacterized protein n=1 Tax=Pseudoalteromonas issachenkonii TaxID=152297 RepID=A0ABM6N4C5_9GAMM|nr:hypothetical protein PISS_a2100 [Pseudoalteromonas issachenkonii]
MAISKIYSVFTTGVKAYFILLIVEAILSISSLSLRGFF